MVRKHNKEILKEYFFRFPTKKLRVRQLERETNLPLPSVTRYVQELVAEGILQSQEIADMTVYTAYRSNPQYKLAKQLYNRQQLYETKLVDYLIQTYDNPLIILFGSYERGEDTQDSDIDIFVQTHKREVSLAKFEKKLDRKIQLFLGENFNTLPSAQLKNNILNGSKLNGFVEVF